MCTIIQHVHFQGTSTLTRCNIECVCVPTFKEDPYVVESHMCARSRNATTHPANTLKYAVHVNMYFASSNMSFLTCQGMSRIKMLRAMFSNQGTSKSTKVAHTKPLVSGFGNLFQRLCGHVPGAPVPNDTWRVASEHSRILDKFSRIL